VQASGKLPDPRQRHTKPEQSAANPHQPDEFNEQIAEAEAPIQRIKNPRPATIV
jgi:hypothetical protein